jgi:hypothetical protein
MREDIERSELAKIRGLSTRDVVSKQYSDSDLELIVSQLRERPLTSDAAFRLASFIFERRENQIPEHLRRTAADNLADCAALSSNLKDPSALEVFIAWGQHRPDYRDICFSSLHHENEMIRHTALSYSPYFLKPHDYSKLFTFHRDPWMSEIGMGGPLRFILRDHALDILEKLTRCPRRAVGDCFEDQPEGRVSFRSWSHFLNWYEKNKKKFEAS